MTKEAFDCRVMLPHSLDGWTMGIYDSNDAHVNRFQDLFSAFQPQLYLDGSVEPGEIQPITGKLDKFHTDTW